MPVLATPDQIRSIERVRQAYPEGPPAAQAPPLVSPIEPYPDAYSPPPRPSPAITLDRLPVFANLAGQVIPDPQTYVQWWDRANEKRRRLAVGTRRFSKAKEVLGREPAWPELIDPATGDLLTLKQIERETVAERHDRVVEVEKKIAERRSLLQQVSTFGFEVPGVVAEAPAEVVPGGMTFTELIRWLTGLAQ